MKISGILFIALLLLMALQCFYYYPQMPATMASHFDGAGQPNGWSSRQLFMVFYFGAVALMVAIFWLMPLALPKIPLRWLNYPNKSYWFAPERREATYTFMKSQFLWFGNLNLALILLVMQMAFAANLDAQPRLAGTIIPVMVVYMLASLAWAVNLIIKAYRPLPAD